MSALRCPVCKAENATPSACRRCKADLSLLWRLEEQRQAALLTATSDVLGQRWEQALTHLDHVDALCRRDDSRRIRALCHLLGRDFRSAWLSYQSRDSGPDSTPAPRST